MKATGHRIPVNAIEEALSFYEALGFETTFQSEEYGWASLQWGDFSLGLYMPGKGGGDRPPGSNVGFLFAVEDLDQVRAGLQGRGLEPSEIVETADGMRLFDIHDPLGNLLTFSG